MNKPTEKQISKLLSLALRHKPKVLDLKLTESGWASVEALIAGLANKGHVVDHAFIEQVVSNNDKQRFTFNESRTQIRANQGHSIAIDLALKPVTPPALLYHGTAIKNLEAIKRDGLLPMKRNQVHLSADTETAHKVAVRHGVPVLLHIDSARMHAEGHDFFLSENKVWLTNQVSPAYIEF